jgi:hypothetical protein
MQPQALRLRAQLPGIPVIYDPDQRPCQPRLAEFHLQPQGWSWPQPENSRGLISGSVRDSSWHEQGSQPAPPKLAQSEGDRR